MSENENARAAAEEKLSQRMRMLKQSMSIVNIAATGGRKALNTSLKGAMPLFEVYSGTTVRRIQQQDTGDQDAPQILDLGPAQSQVVKAAGAKLFYEMLEIASITHPIYDGAPAYRKFAVEGKEQTPHLVHFLALGAAANDLLNIKNEKPEHPVEAAQPEIADSEQAVAYMTVAPGEYVAASGPQSPSQIRRAAMRERTYNKPPMAMMASNNQPLAYSAANMGSHGYTSKVVPISSRQMPSTRTATAPHLKPNTGRSCGCGGHSSCGCGGATRGCSCGKCGHHPFGDARYNDDGTCAPTTKISCETRWRLRDCVKFAFCDMLRCMSDEMCDDDCRFKDDEESERDLGGCVEVFLCSLINCLPEAICPPLKTEKCCHDAAPAPACGCNYAVGSKSNEY